MRRREFVAGLAGAAAWPITTHAQQRGQVRRVGILMGGLLQGDVDGESELKAFREELDSLGWKLGGNIQFEYRWPGTDNERVGAAARELAGSHVEVVLSRATSATLSLTREAPALPVVFVLVVEPVRSGLVQ